MIETRAGLCSVLLPHSRMRLHNAGKKTASCQRGEMDGLFGISGEASAALGSESSILDGSVARDVCFCCGFCQACPPQNIFGALMSTNERSLVDHNSRLRSAPTKRCDSPCGTRSRCCLVCAGVLAA